MGFKPDLSRFLEDRPKPSPVKLKIADAYVKTVYDRENKRHAEIKKEPGSTLGLLWPDSEFIDTAAIMTHHKKGKSSLGLALAGPKGNKRPQPVRSFEKPGVPTFVLVARELVRHQEGLIMVAETEYSSTHPFALDRKRPELGYSLDAAIIDATPKPSHHSVNTPTTPAQRKAMQQIFDRIIAKIPEAANISRETKAFFKEKFILNAIATSVRYAAPSSRGPR
jgi:hypothetical protein